MIIYEVNLQVERRIIQPYLDWLAPHVQKMLQFPGFLDVVCLQEQTSHSTEYHQLTLQYHIASMTDLTYYLEHHAHKMREEAQEFTGKFLVSRRIFSVIPIDNLRLSYTE